MNALSRKASRRVSIESLIVFGIGLVTLALWMMPAFTGGGSTWDVVVCAVWAICLIGLLALNYRRVLREETQRRTVYIDSANRMIYNQNIGVVPYRNGCQLTELMGSSFAKKGAASRRCELDEDDFLLSAIIRTTAFDFEMNDAGDFATGGAGGGAGGTASGGAAGESRAWSEDGTTALPTSAQTGTGNSQTKVTSDTFAFENMTILEWRGVTELVESDRKISFESLGELEDLLCPLMLADALSIVGPCPDANTDACMCKEQIIRRS